MSIDEDADLYVQQMQAEKKAAKPAKKQARREGLSFRGKPREKGKSPGGLPRILPLALVSVLVVALASAFLSDDKDKDASQARPDTSTDVVVNVDAWQEQVKSAGERKSNLQPAPHVSTAAWMLQGASGGMAQGKNSMAFWFDQDFIANGERWHFYFFHLERPDSRVEVGAKVGLVVFRLLPVGQWVPMMVNPAFTENGSRGIATRQKKAQFMAVSADSHVMTLLNNVETFEGTRSYFDLFTFAANGEIKPAGHIDAGMNNLNMQCDGADPLPTGFNRACVSYTGELRVVPIKGAGQTVSDLRVEYKGQNAEPPKVYSYLGGSWQARDAAW